MYQKILLQVQLIKKDRKYGKNVKSYSAIFAEKAAAFGCFILGKFYLVTVLNEENTFL